MQFIFILLCDCFLSNYIITIAISSIEYIQANSLYYIHCITSFINIVLNLKSYSSGEACNMATAKSKLMSSYIKRDV